MCINVSSGKTGNTQIRSQEGGVGVGLRDAPTARWIACHFLLRNQILNLEKARTFVLNMFSARGLRNNFDQNFKVVPNFKSKTWKWISLKHQQIWQLLTVHTMLRRIVEETRRKFCPLNDDEDHNIVLTITHNSTFNAWLLVLLFVLNVYKKEKCMLTPSTLSSLSLK